MNLESPQTPQSQESVETPTHQENLRSAEIAVKEMFDGNMEARGTIRNVIEHGVMHPSERR